MCYKIEIWEDIEAFKNYQVSNLGRVRHKKKKIILACSSAGKSLKYKKVSLSQNGKISHRLVHRLTAQTFVKNPDPEIKTTVNHIFNDPGFNFAENLEWLSWSEQEVHKRFLAGIGTDNKGTARDAYGNYI